MAPPSLRTQIWLIDMRTHFPDICISRVMSVVMFCFSPPCASFVYFSLAPGEVGNAERSTSEGQEGNFSPPARIHRALLANDPEERLRWYRVEEGLRGGPGGCCGFISQDCFVTKWAWCEYHLDSTYLKLARLPRLPAWQPRDGNKLHHLLNMHLTWCLLKEQGEIIWLLFLPGSIVSPTSLSAATVKRLIKKILKC